MTALVIGTLSPRVFADDSQIITIADKMTFAEGVQVADAIRSECNLESKFANFVKAYLEEAHFQVHTTKEDLARQTGKVLDVHIISVHGSSGFWDGSGSGSMVTMRATLRENGEPLKSFAYYRKSVRRFAGVCDLLESCVNTLGRDVANWVAQTRSRTMRAESAP